MSPNGTYLSIIVPAYNESQRILPTLEHLHAFVKKQSYRCEVIVVDDCSKDNTAQIVEKFIGGKNMFRLLRHSVNLGKGASVKDGMLAATGQFRLFSDADLSTPIEEVHKLFSYLESGYQVAIGSRRVRGANVAKRQPVHREASGRVFSVLVRLLTLRGFLDTQCGFKMFTAQAAQDVFSKLTIPRFGFDVEILYIAKNRYGYKIKEVPVTWFDSPATQVQLWRDSTRMFLDLFKIRWNGLLGKYRR